MDIEAKEYAMCQRIIGIMAETLEKDGYNMAEFSKDIVNDDGFCFDYNESFVSYMINLCRSSVVQLRDIRKKKRATVKLKVNK